MKHILDVFEIFIVVTFCAYTLENMIFIMGSVGGEGPSLGSALWTASTSDLSSSPLL